MRSVSKKLRLMFVLQCSGFVSEPAVFVYLIVFICVHQGPSSDIPENIDYDFAQQELMLQQMEDDPIQVAIRSIEKQHEEDKQGKFFCSYWCHGFKSWCGCKKLQFTNTQLQIPQREGVAAQSCNSALKFF